jgi:signal transduction histidine kinase
MEAELSDLLQQLAEAFTGRVRVPVDLTVEGPCALPTDVKVAVYRIAQEALNNVAKHAHARRVDVLLSCTPAQVMLRVRDDGRGFDGARVPSDHLGLGIMAERAEDVGGALDVRSAPGEGTEIVFLWVPPENRRSGE